MNKDSIHSSVKEVYDAFLTDYAEFNPNPNNVLRSHLLDLERYIDAIKTGKTESIDYTQVEKTFDALENSLKKPFLLQFFGAFIACVTLGLSLAIPGYLNFFFGNIKAFKSLENLRSMHEKVYNDIEKSKAQAGISSSITNTYQNSSRVLQSSDPINYISSHFNSNFINRNARSRSSSSEINDSDFMLCETPRTSHELPDSFDIHRITADELFDILYQMINKNCVGFNKKNSNHQDFFENICNKVGISFSYEKSPQWEYLQEDGYICQYTLYSKKTNSEFTEDLKQYFKDETSFDYEEYEAIKEMPKMKDEVFLEKINLITSNDNFNCHSYDDAKIVRWILKYAKINHTEVKLTTMDNQRGENWLSATIDDKDKDKKLNQFYSMVKNKNDTDSTIICSFGAKF